MYVDTVMNMKSDGLFSPPKDGPGIKDPCEKEVVDGLSLLTLQQREEITQSAQVTSSCTVCRQAC